LQKLETFLSIFIFNSLGRKCATRGERLIEADTGTFSGKDDLYSEKWPICMRLSCDSLVLSYSNYEEVRRNMETISFSVT